MSSENQFEPQDRRREDAVANQRAVWHEVVVEEASSGVQIRLADDLPDEAYASLFEIEFDAAPAGACFYYDLDESRWRFTGE